MVETYETENVVSYYAGGASAHEVIGLLMSHLPNEAGTDPTVSATITVHWIAVGTPEREHAYEGVLFMETV